MDDDIKLLGKTQARKALLDQIKDESGGGGKFTDTLKQIAASQQDSGLTLPAHLALHLGLHLWGRCGLTLPCLALALRLPLRLSLALTIGHARCVPRRDVRAGRRWRGVRRLAAVGAPMDDLRFGWRFRLGLWLLFRPGVWMLLRPS